MCPVSRDGHGDPLAMGTSSAPRLLLAEGASLGCRRVPQALLPAEVENALLQLPNCVFIPLY